MTEYKTIRFERNDRVGTLTLCRPEKRNAQNPLMWRELAQLGAQLLDTSGLRCLIVAGEGPSFSTGVDLVEGLAGTIAASADAVDDPDTRRRGEAAVNTFSWIQRLDCPSVAAVNGHAFGAGLQLALACDFRVFAKSAQAGLLETRFGLLPDMGATVRLPRIVGTGRALELILFGEVIDASEALRIGLANRVVLDEDLSSAAGELADRLAAQPPIAMRGARRALEAAWDRSPEEGMAAALKEQMQCLASEDFREALIALEQGRAPEWKGR